jgi:hypothetical protein
LDLVSSLGASSQNFMVFGASIEESMSKGSAHDGILERGPTLHKLQDETSPFVTFCIMYPLESKKIKVKVQEKGLYQVLP